MQPVAQIVNGNRVMEKEVSTVMTCKMCAMFVFLPMEDSNYTGTKCKLIRLLDDKVGGLKACLATLSLIHENEEYLRKAGVCIQIKHSREETTTRKNEALEQGSPNPGLRTGIGMQCTRNQAVQASEASSAPAWDASSV